MVRARPALNTLQSRQLWLVCVAFAAAFLACGDPEPVAEPTWLPYVGDAYVHTPQPIAWPKGAIALTSDNGSDTLTAFDPTTGKLVAQTTIGRDPVAIDGPHHLAIDRKRGAAFVALAYPAPPIALGPHAAHGSSKRPGYVQWLDFNELRLVAEQRIEPNPGDIALSADGSFLAITHFDLEVATSAGPIAVRRGPLTVIDTATLGKKLPVTIPLCVLPHGLVLAADGKRAWAACYGEDAVAAVDLAASPPTVVRVAVDGSAPTATEKPPGAPSYGPYSATGSPSGLLLAIGTTESRDLRFFDTEKQAMATTVWKHASAGAAFFAGWSADSKTVWLPTQSTDALFLIEVASGKTLVSRVFSKAECEKPHEAVQTAEGVVLVACEGNHVAPGQVIAVDPLTLATLWTLPVGAYPDRIALAAGL